MQRLIERIVGKKIVIWGIGAIQIDIEALFPELKVEYYIDDLLDEKKGRIWDRDVLNVFKPERLQQESKDDIMVIICEQKKESALGYMDLFGLVKNFNYIVYEKLLYEFSVNEFARRFMNDKIVVWGTGATFEDYQDYLVEQSQGISFFIDGNLKEHKKFYGYDVFPSSKGMSYIQEEKLIVTSTYYPIIVEELKKRKISPGVNCLFVGTFHILCEYYRLFYDVEYTFENRQKKSTYLLVVLAGYKEKLWESVFDRISKFVPDNYDICVLSSGVYSEKLSKVCQIHQWSYLSTKKNNISVILNIAIHIHGAANWIMKMDEDIFITKNTFQIMETTYWEFVKNEKYEIGFVSPLIPVNTYGYTKILKLLGKEEEWRKQFGNIKLTDGLHHHLNIVENPASAKLLWGDEKAETIDQLSEKTGMDPIHYSICPSRYSIGLIFFSKELWIDMKMFPDKGGSNFGVDESRINEYCMMSGKAVVIAENVVVGHLAYREQTEAMMKYYESILKPGGL